MDKSADRLDGAEGDWPTYPWPEKEFTGELCGKNLRYKRKDPGDYDVFDRDSGKQVGICTKAPEVDSKSCGVWIQATYSRVYQCTGAC
ncbi:hypothetical protein MN608_00216 [Microdochium nivale]|nr:hypothetical protein MN608_00216 [Microdochium nivale]